MIGVIALECRKCRRTSQPESTAGLMVAAAVWDGWLTDEPLCGSCVRSAVSA